MTSVAVIGTTRWGTTLAMLLGRTGAPVRLWARTESEACAINSARENPVLSGHRLPDSVTATASVAECVGGASVVIFAVPSQTVRANAQVVRPHLTTGQTIVSATKGLEEGPACRMSQVLAEELGCDNQSIAVLSGPNLSGEIVHGLPAATVIAAEDITVAEGVRQAFGDGLFRVEVSDDVVGVEMGGALKNIVAIGAGLSDGLGCGENGKAVLMVRGLADMVRLAGAVGGRRETLLGLAGLGDLLATCSSTQSRNHHVGEQLARGRSLSQAMAGRRGVCEGVPAARGAWKLSREVGVEVPVFESIYRVLYEALPAQEAAASLFGTYLELASSR